MADLQPIDIAIKEAEDDLRALCPPMFCQVAGCRTPPEGGRFFCAEHQDEFDSVTRDYERGAYELTDA